MIKNSDHMTKHMFLFGNHLYLYFDDFRHVEDRDFVWTILTSQIFHQYAKLYHNMCWSC